MAKPHEFELLTTLDMSKIKWYHFKVLIVTGIGFFTVAYELFSIAVVYRILGRLYYTEPNLRYPGYLPFNVSFAINSMAVCGTFVGQLLFGWLGDKLGRTKTYGVTLLMMGFFSIASGLSFSPTAKGVITTLCFFRFWVGISVGGNYSLSAVIMSECANKKTRGTFTAAVFAMQGIGILVSCAVSITISAAFEMIFKPPPFEEDPIASLTPECDYIWRMILMFGAFPAALSYCFFTQIPETARYTGLVAHDSKQAIEEMSKVLNVTLDVEDANFINNVLKNRKQNFGLLTKEFARLYGMRLVGTTCSWFFFRIALSTSQNILQRDILYVTEWIPRASTMSAIGEVYKVGRAQLLIAVCGFIPGYWFSVALIDVVGRKPIQLVGYLNMTIFMFVIAYIYDTTFIYNKYRVLILCGITFFFANFGPNATNFVVPAEIFPARFRTTCYGISVAAGWVGGAIGTYGFYFISQDKDPLPNLPAGIGKRNSLFIVCGINFIGMFFTFLVPEAKGKSLEEASNEVLVEDQEDAAAANSGDRRFSVV